MTTYASPICMGCKHFFDSDDMLHCVAFPDGIPPEIIRSQFDHHFPHPRDNGIQFAPKEGNQDERIEEGL